MLQFLVLLNQFFCEPLILLLQSRDLFAKGSDLQSFENSVLVLMRVPFNLLQLVLQDSDLVFELFDVLLVLFVLFDLLFLLAIGLVKLLVLFLHYTHFTLKKFFSSSSWEQIYSQLTCPPRFDVFSASR